MGLQLVTSGAGELGVQSQYLDGERHLVDDALAGSMPTAEKLQVLDAVVGSNTVDVVDSLVGEQVSSERLFHDVAMFEGIAGSPAVNSRDDHSNITVSGGAFGWLLPNMFPLVAKSAKQRAAFGAAQALLPVYRAPRSSLNGHCFVTLYASDLPFIIRKLAAYAAAFSGAVGRFFAPFLYVSTQVTRFHGEGLVAHFARKQHRLYLRSFPAMKFFVGCFTSQGAKAAGFLGWLNGKGLSALFTIFLNRHLSLSMLNQFGVGSTEACASK